MNIEKEKRAIGYLRAFEPKDEPYYLCYSADRGTAEEPQRNAVYRRGTFGG